MKKRMLITLTILWMAGSITGIDSAVNNPDKTGTLAFWCLHLFLAFDCLIFALFFLSPIKRTSR